MCDPHDFNRRHVSAAAGPEPRDHRYGHNPRSVPGGSGTYCSRESTISPFLFSSRADCTSSAPQTCCSKCLYLFTICLFKQYACATALRKLIDVLHVHLLGGRQAEHRALSPRGRNRRAGFRPQRAGAGSDGKGRRWRLARLHSLHLIHL